MSKTIKHPVIGKTGKIEWQPNSMYHSSELQVKTPADYTSLCIEKGNPAYTQFEENK